MLHPFALLETSIETNQYGVTGCSFRFVYSRRSDIQLLSRYIFDTPDISPG